MAVRLGPSVHQIDPEWNVATTIGWIAVIFGTYIHVLFTMNYSNFGDSPAFKQAQVKNLIQLQVQHCGLVLCDISNNYIRNPVCPIYGSVQKHNPLDSKLHIISEGVTLFCNLLTPHTRHYCNCLYSRTAVCNRDVCETEWRESGWELPICWLSFTVRLCACHHLQPNHFPLAADYFLLHAPH